MALSKITTESLLDGEITAAKFATGVGGKVVQVVNVTTGAVATGTTTLPHDDTIAQNTEGDQYMTLAITPTSSSNKLKIEVIGHWSNSSGADWMSFALFQDSTANTLAVGRYTNDAATRGNTMGFSHYMTAGTTSETTFKVRAGTASAGTTTFNGSSGSRVHGGLMSSSITITEISA